MAQGNMQLESDQLRSSIASLLDSRSKNRLSQTGRALSAQRACESLRSGRCGQKNVCYPMHQNNCFVYPGDASGLDEASHCCFAEIRNLFAPKMSMAMIKRKGGDPSRIRKLWAVLWKSSERARKEEILTALLSQPNAEHDAPALEVIMDNLTARDLHLVPHINNIRERTGNLVGAKLLEALFRVAHRKHLAWPDSRNSCSSCGEFDARLRPGQPCEYCCGAAAEMGDTDDD